MSVPGEDLDYPDPLIAFLETVWGEGYLSPGGPEEVDRVLDGLTLAGKRVLDLGCGTGGIALHLVEAHDAGEVVGIDIEDPVVEKARSRAREHPLGDRVEIAKVSPGPLPFEAEAFDVVFSKDAMIHIPDKHALMADVFRILRPGGVLAASDWLIGHDGEPTPAMAEYIESEGLSFGMASPARYRQALEAAGFTDIALNNRNRWYFEKAQRERAAIAGELYEPAVAAAGRELVDHNISTWDRMLVVLETGEHCPHHLRAKKPAVTGI